MLVLSVQMPEGDGKGWVRFLTKPERVRREGWVEGWGRGGGGKTGGKRRVQLREKRRVVQHHIWAVGWGRFELRNGAHINWRV